MYDKSNMNTHTTICRRDSQRVFAVGLRKKLVRWCQPGGVGWGGRWEGGSKGRGLCTPMADSC